MEYVLKSEEKYIYWSIINHSSVDLFLETVYAPGVRPVIALVKVQSVKFLELIHGRRIREIYLFEVRFDTRRCDGLGKYNRVTLDGPGDQCLAGVNVEFRGNLLNLGIFDDTVCMVRNRESRTTIEEKPSVKRDSGKGRDTPKFIGIVVTERAVGLDEDALVLQELCKLLLLKIGMCFDLVDGGRDLSAVDGIEY